MKRKEPTKLKNPPILEAIVDITLQEEEGLSAENFNISLQDYSKDKNINEGRITIFSEDSSVKVGQIGVRYKNNKNSTDFRVNGFSYNHLEDYTGWDDFKNNAFRLWDSYKEIRTKTEILRLGLRFINIIKIPKESNISDYLCIGINFPDDYSLGNISQYKYTYFTEFKENSCKAVVNLTKKPATESETQDSFILDIDVFIKDLPEVITDQMLDLYLCKMRDVKNEIFFQHLTDKKLEEYK